MTMGQILIISDSHFLRKKDLDQFIASIPHIDATIHCGDIYLGYKPGDIANLYMCKGNNDFADIPYISHFTIDNTTFTNRYLLSIQLMSFVLVIHIFPIFIKMKI